MPSLAELKKRATELKIQGRSKMKKSELEEAIKKAGGKGSPVKPPSVKPPLVKPPSVKPPSVKPPLVKPPSVKFNVNSHIESLTKEIHPDLKITRTTAQFLSNFLEAFYRKVGVNSIDAIKKISEPAEYLSGGMEHYIQTTQQTKLDRQLGDKLGKAVNYLAREILELAGNGARDMKQKSITPTNILYVLNDDMDLNILFCSLKEQFKGLKCK